MIRIKIPSTTWRNEIGLDLTTRQIRELAHTNYDNKYRRIRRVDMCVNQEDRINSITDLVTLLFGSFRQEMMLKWSSSKRWNNKTLCLVGLKSILTSTENLFRSLACSTNSSNCPINAGASKLEQTQNSFPLKLVAILFGSTDILLAVSTVKLSEIK